MTAFWRSVALLMVMSTVPSHFRTSRLAGVSRAEAQGTVRGVVFDSLALRPLAGAIVQLVPAEGANGTAGAVPSDSLGRFVFADVPAGQYTIGFLHPVLDSLGVEAPMRELSVQGSTIVRADLAVPSAARLRLAICGVAANGEPHAVVTGLVRDAATGAPVDSARVEGAWAEISLGKTGMQRRTPRLVTRARANGWFGICGVPHPGTVQLMATHDADSSDAVEVDVPASGLLRRDLYIGTFRTEIRTDSSATPGVPAMRTSISVGDHLIQGTVMAAQGNRRLAGAQVGIVNGPQVRTNDRGEWTIANAPPGTRTLEVRAVGYYPHRVAVDVTNGMRPLEATLVTFKAMLDTIKVRARYERYSSLAGFRERQRSGVGHFLSAEEVARRRPIVTTDLFRMVPGVFLDGPRGSDQLVLMRGAFTPRCTPTISLNGSLMSRLTALEIDAFVAPREIVGIEVYSASYVPAQFQSPMADCGSIVIWTR